MRKVLRRDISRAVVACLFLVSSQSGAQTVIDWTAGGTSDYYGNSFNWSGLNVPNTTSESAKFNLAGSFNVTIQSGLTETVSDLIVQAGDINFTANGAVLATYSADDDLIVSGGNLTLRSIGGSARVIFNVADDVQVSAGSFLSIDGGSDLNTLDLFVGRTSSGDGTVVVDGSGSTLMVSGLVILGSSGSTGTLTYQNGSTLNDIDNTLTLASGSVAGSTGRLHVLSGSTLDTASLRVGSLSTSASAVQEATVTVDGIDSVLTMTGASTLTVGDATNPNVTSDVIVSSGGEFNSGTGAILIQNSGTLSITDGTFNANGALTMTAGTTLTLDGGALNAAAGLDNSANGTLDFRDGTLTVSGGQFDPNDGVAFDGYIIDGPTLIEMPHLVLDAGTTFNLGSEIIVGDANRGELTLAANMALSSGTTTIGDQAGSTGVATIDGAGALLFASSSINLGDAGDGTLNIQNGGKASSGTITLFDSKIGVQAGSTGTATVDGVGSDWTLGRDLDIGVGGQGTLNILNGGTLSVDRNLEVGSASAGQGTLDIQSGGTVSSVRGEIGKNDGSTGTATVDGAGSVWTNSLVQTVADRGMGTLNILNGGTVSTPNATIGQNSAGNGTVNVDGADSTWTITSVSPFRTLTIGSIGDAVLNITAGGTVSSTITVIASNNPSSTGSVTVDGTGSTWTNTGDLYIGGRSNSAAGLGDVTVQNSGLINVGGTLKIWSTGTVTLDGGTLNAGTLDHTDGGILNFIDGTLAVDTFLGDLTQDGGTIAPGDSPGLTAITGDFTINAGTLEIEVGGPASATEYDLVTVTGTATLGGVLDLSLINGFTPGLGDTFQFITAATRAGTFASITGADLGGGLAFDVIYGTTDVTLQVISSLLDGDLNGDGFVGVDDLNIVLINWNQTVTPGDLLSGDPSGEGFVGVDDLNIVLVNWNNGTPPAAGGAIPEPGTLIMLCAYCAVLLRRSVAVRVPDHSPG